MVNRLSLVRACLTVVVAGFFTGVVTHGLDFLERGPRPYAGEPLALEAFWSALLLLDASTVILLLIGRRKAGLILALVIMVVDVAANSVAHHGLGFGAVAWKLQLQTLFLGFVLGSVGFLWPAR